MPSQNDFDRITKYIIHPMQKLFSGEINDYAIESMIEDLSGYSDEVLQGAMKILRKTCKRIPSLAHVVEACEEAGKFKYSAPSFEQRTAKPVDQTAMAVAVMKSNFGQMALREGWANDVWVITMRTGRTDYTEKDAVKFRANLQEAIKDAAMLDKAKEPMDEQKRKQFGILMDIAMAKSLWGLWIAFQQKERMLHDKYIRVLPAPQTYQAYKD